MRPLHPATVVVAQRLERPAGAVQAEDELRRPHGGLAVEGVHRLVRRPRPEVRKGELLDVSGRKPRAVGRAKEVPV